ncbi:MAG: OmpH family outer membrane protein [Bacteroidota bacterium]
MIKKIFLFAAFFSVAAFTMNAQRIAVVDINKVLESMDDYRKAQDELDKLAATWRTQIAQEYDKIKSMYNKYQAEQVLLSDEVRTQREDEIMNKEKEVRELQKDKFGPEGALFRKRQELVNPIQQKVYAAVEEYANDRGYDFIFDLAGSAGILFSKEEYNKTDDVLKRLRN